MIEYQQPLLDLDGFTLDSHWRLNELAQAADWTDEALCLQWIWPKSNWRHHKAWFDALPGYERDSMLNMWRYEMSKPPAIRRTFKEIEIDLDSFHQHVNELSEVWAVEIREAAKHRRPMPITPNPASPLGMCAFDRAFDLAGVVSIDNTVNRGKE